MHLHIFLNYLLMYSFVYLLIFICVYIYICISIYIYICLCAHVGMYVCLSVCGDVCTHTYIYTHRSLSFRSRFWVLPTSVVQPKVAPSLLK